MMMQQQQPQRIPRKPEGKKEKARLRKLRKQYEKNQIAQTYHQQHMNDGNYKPLSVKQMKKELLAMREENKKLNENVSKGIMIMTIILFAWWIFRLWTTLQFDAIFRYGIVFASLLFLFVLSYVVGSCMMATMRNRQGQEIEVMYSIFQYPPVRVFATLCVAHLGMTCAILIDGGAAAGKLEKINDVNITEAEIKSAYVDGITLAAIPFFVCNVICVLLVIALPSKLVKMKVHQSLTEVNQFIGYLIIAGLSLLYSIGYNIYHRM